MVIRSQERVGTAVLLAALFACGRPSPAPAPAKTSDPTAMNTQRDTPPAEVRPARPKYLAAVENNEAEARLVLVEAAAGKKTALAPLAADVRWLAWTPDGSWLLYLTGQRLRASTVTSGQDALLAEGVSAQASSPFAVSPDNRLIAVVAGSDILLAPVNALPSFRPAIKAKMPAGCGLVDLCWSPTGNSVLVLCYPAPGTESSQLLWIEAATGKMRVLPPSAVKRLLGWRPSGQLVMVRDGPAFDEAALFSPDGSVLPWGPPREPGEVFILAYAPARDLVLEVTASEDAGDPVNTYLSPFGDHAIRPWLHRYPRLTDLKFSPGGTWAAFADRGPYGAGEMPGGNIYIVETGSEDAQLVIRGTPGVRTYSSPTIRP